MKQLALSILRFFAAAALIFVAFLNLWHSGRITERMRLRADDDVVILERRMIGIRNALLEVRYRGDLGYMPAAVLNGNPKTQKESERWIQARYVMIPWNLLENSMAAPYVIVDSQTEPSALRIPEGFIKRYDSGAGLVLLQQMSRQ